MRAVEASPHDSLRLDVLELLIGVSMIVVVMIGTAMISRVGVVVGIMSGVVIIGPAQRLSSAQGAARCEWRVAVKSASFVNLSRGRRA